MAKCKYNDVILPELPQEIQGHPYRIIQFFNQTYYLIGCSEPFVYSDGGILHYLKSASVCVFACISVSYAWKQTELIRISDGDSEYVGLISTGSFVWANTDTYYIDSAKIAHYGSDPIPVMETTPADYAQQYTYNIWRFVKGYVLGIVGDVLRQADKDTAIGWLVGKRIATGQNLLQDRGPGLYYTGTGNLKHSWKQLLGDDLLEGGVIHMEDGVLKGNPDGFLGLHANHSSPFLVGDLVLPEDSGITEIGHGAFCHCTGLTSIVIPEGVQKIDTSFLGCTALTNVVLPSTLVSMTGTGLYQGVFQYCSSLKSIVLPDNLVSLGQCAFNGATSLENVNIPNGVTTIELWAFADCSSLTEIFIPASVMSIEGEAFIGCTALTTVVLGATTPPKMNHSAFGYNDSDNGLTKIVVPAGCAETYKASSDWSKYADIIVEE